MKKAFLRSVNYVLALILTVCLLFGAVGCNKANKSEMDAEDVASKFVAANAKGLTVTARRSDERAASLPQPASDGEEKNEDPSELPGGQTTEKPDDPSGLPGAFDYDLDNWQFADLLGETTLTVPQDVASICNVEFHGCEGLTSLTIVGDLETVCNFQFYDCKDLKNVTLPASLAEIANFEFHDCDAIETLVVSEDSKHIGNFQFYACDGLQKLEISLNADDIDNFEFHDCKNLVGFAVSGNVGKIGNVQLYDCNQTKSFVASGNVENIDNFQIYDSTALEKALVLLNAGYVNSIEFHDCPALSVVALTKLKKTARLVMENCPLLQSVCIDGTTEIDEWIHAYLYGGGEANPDVYLYSQEKTQEAGRWYVDDGEIVIVGKGVRPVEGVEFYIRWGVFGQSSYDSKSGLLIKTTDTVSRDPKDYQTTLTLSEDQKNAVLQVLKSIDLWSYPDVYDPFETEDGATVASSPSQTIVLTVGDKTVLCPDVALGGASASPRGQEFLQAVDAIVEMLTSTDEWQALPEYEVYYD